MGTPLHKKLARSLDHPQSVDALPLELRNPWTDVNPAKEFVYDMTHPLVFLKRGWLGIRGLHPKVPPAHRWIGIAMLCQGFVMMGVGLFAIIYTH
jgi:hypothetical protein